MLYSCRLKDTYLSYLQTCETAISAFQDTLACVLYFNTEEEPSVYVNTNSTVEIKRQVRLVWSIMMITVLLMYSYSQILIEVLDNGIPPGASTAISIVQIKAINDHAPVVTVNTAENCVTTSTASRVRRYISDEWQLAPITNGQHTHTMRQVPVPVSLCVSHIYDLIVD